MAKKKFKLNFVFDAPVTISFCLISVVLFVLNQIVLNQIVLKGSLDGKILSSPTTSAGPVPFIASNPASYFRLFLYAFGAQNWVLLFTNLMFLLMLGPSQEERYGSVVIGIMMGVSILFSGVLNACFCETSLKGCNCVIFMMIFLNSFMSFSKKKIPASFFIIFIFYIIKEILQVTDKRFSGIVGLIICITGGLCGSLFAFLTSPKARAEKKSEKTSKPISSMTAEEKTAFLEELDSQSPRNRANKTKKSDSNDDDTTVIGTIKF